MRRTLCVQKYVAMGRHSDSHHSRDIRFPTETATVWEKLVRFERTTYYWYAVEE
jgi:hypothetical protein